MLTPAMFEEMVEESQLRSIVQRIEKETNELYLEAKNLDNIAHAPIPRQECRDSIQTIQNKIDTILDEIDKAKKQLDV